MMRDFSKELREARETKDWVAHERIWEERRCAEVDYDESALWLSHGDDAIFNRKEYE